MSKKRNKPIKETVVTEPATVKDYLTVDPISVVKDYLTTEVGKLLAVLTAIGAALRFYNLSGNSLWLDEATTYVLSTYDLGKIWAIGFTGDNNPPLFHWITHFMLMLGNSEFILRLLPVLMGIATIPIIYLIGKEIKDKYVGIIAAALVTFSPFCIHYAREAYSYSMVLFVSSLVILYYIKAIKTNEKKNWIIFGVLSALAFWTHFYTFVILIVMYSHAIITLRGDILSTKFKNLTNPAYALITTAVLSAPVVYMAVSRFMTISNQAVTYGVLGVALIPETLFRFSGWNWSVAGVFILTSIIGLTYLYVKNKQMLTFSLMFIILPVIISVILSSKMTMNPRYLIYLLPVIFVTMACCYALLEIIITDKRLVYAIIAIIVLVNALPLAAYYSNPTSEDWRGYSSRLTASTNAGDIVVAVPGYISTPLNYYYNNKTDGTMMMYADTLTEINAAVNQKTNGKVYFVVTGDINAVNPQGDVLQWFNTKSVALGQYSGIYTFSA